MTTSNMCLIIASISVSLWYQGLSLTLFPTKSRHLLLTELRYVVVEKRDEHLLLRNFAATGFNASISLQKCYLLKRLDTQVCRPKPRGLTTCRNDLKIEPNRDKKPALGSQICTTLTALLRHLASNQIRHRDRIATCFTKV